MTEWLVPESERIAVALLRLLVSAVMGTLLAYHPRRRPRPLDEERQATAKTQILMAVAAAVMVQVIGESTARAFGLLGLGSSIRFRTNVQSPVDAAVLFVGMGIGMAAGLAEYRLAVTVTAFTFVALFFLEPGRKEVLGHDKKLSGDRR
ncbi:MAG: MgtC/SapB family protein [Deltaproteobacteria bacterium]|nr:MgtC/SapB family protein [Deltaproteobacteria bacterium]